MALQARKLRVRLSQLRGHSCPAAFDASSQEVAVGQDRQAADPAHVMKQLWGAARPLGVCVAADHQEIADVVEQCGGEVRMTDPARR